jgi:hypothetical protein
VSGSRSLAGVVVAALSVATYAQSPPATSWLDRPLSNWNRPGAALPNAPIARAARDRSIRTCDLKPAVSTAAERALDAAGWIPFLNFDQQLVQGDIEIVDGMIGGDGMCRPIGYNIFVFIGGRFAGVLSPAAMNAQADSSAGAVRILGADSLSAEFVRYAANDAMCCPSSRVTVRYRIDRSGAAPVVVPTDLRVTRGL